MEKKSNLVTIEEFQICLQKFLSCTNSEELKEIEKRMKMFTKNPQSIAQISQLLNT